MWDLAVAFILGIIADCLKKVSLATYNIIRRKLDRERSVPEIMDALKAGDLRIGDKLTVCGTLSEYVPLRNPAQWLPPYRELKFSTRDPFAKSNERYDQEYLDAFPASRFIANSSGFITKWIGEGSVEITPLPTTTARLQPVGDVFAASLLASDEQYAYARPQIPLFYSHLYCDNSVGLLNSASGDSVVLDCIVVPVPTSYNEVLSYTAPLIVREEGSAVPFGLKVQSVRSANRGKGLYINQWVLGHFASSSLSSEAIWEQVVWEHFLKGNERFQVGGDEGRRDFLPFFSASHELAHNYVLLLEKGGVQHDVYLTTMLIKPNLFQVFLAKSPTAVPEIRTEFAQLAGVWMSNAQHPFLTTESGARVDWQFDQRSPIWQ